MKQFRIFSLSVVLITGLLYTLSCNSCQSGKQAAVTEPYSRVSPDFSADSAYSFIQAQVDFGARVPGTEAHEACGDYLSSKLKRYGATVVEQHAEITHYNGQNLPIRNIVGSWHPEKEKRILLFAHWDSRPFADEETDDLRQQQPIAGADDGGSGVGVLLEIARQLHQQPTEVGIDIIFFDLEDWGQPSSDKELCMAGLVVYGPQYWTGTPHVENYRAAYGSCLIWWEAVMLPFSKRGTPCNMHPVWWKKYGVLLPDWDMATSLYPRVAAISPTIMWR